MSEKRATFAAVFTGCSAVRLAHLLWEQGVVGSNPATPTKNKSTYSNVGAFAVLRNQLQLLRIFGINCKT